MRLLMLLPLLLTSVAGAVNNLPVVGVLTQPLNATHNYIGASYVKFAESAGARVVPLHITWNKTEMKKMFNNINGVIFPGGKITLEGGYRESGRYLLKLARDAKDAGDPFPILGICLGMQLLSVLVSDDTVLCSHCFKTDGTPLPLNFTSAPASSKLFKDMPRSLIDALQTQNLTANFHHDGVALDAFHENKKLSEFFSLVSTSRLGNGDVFVSTMEAKNYPIIGTQWHPEKANFEWRKDAERGYDIINHSFEAVAVSQHVANVFVNFARQSLHRFDENLESSIFHYEPLVPDPDKHLDEIYVWPAEDLNAATTNIPKRVI